MRFTIFLHINDTLNNSVIIVKSLMFFFSDERNSTVCPLTVNESEMTAGECMTLEVYAEQYGVESKKKAHNVCYYGKK